MTIVVNSTNTQFLLNGATPIKINDVVSTSPVTYANYLGKTIIIKDAGENTLATIVVKSDGTFSMVLEDTVIVQRDLAFYGCTNLTSVTIPSNMTSIGNGMFYGCTSLVSVVIPSGATSIGNDMFHGCIALSSVTIPSSVTRIGNDMFHGCIVLASVTIPSSVTSLGYNMCYGCVGLLSATILAQISAIGHDTFRNCSSLQTLSIPDGVTTIGDDAFSGCVALNAITLPSAMTTLGNSVFSGCSVLRTIILPVGITVLGDSVFEDCSALISLSIPPAVSNIGNNVFAGCSLLQTVTIPSSVVSIGDFAFIDCASLTTLTLPSGLITIGNNMCYNCVSLTRVTIPSTVVTIGNAAFFNCSKLDDVVIPSGVTSIGNYAFYGCSAMKNITIPSSVVTLGNSAFQLCVGLQSANMLANIKSIENSMFHGCRSLATITIPTSVTALGNFVFCECSSLISVTIPQNVVSIGNFVFQFSGLKSIIVANNNSSFASIDGILYNKALTTLLCYPPRKIGDTYTVPSSVTIIAPAGISGCVSLKNILSDSVVFTSVNGILYGADNTTLLFYPSGKTDSAFAMTSSVTTVQSDCFVDCLFSSITIGVNVTEIQSWFLQKCNNVTMVTIPSGVVFEDTYAVDSKSFIFFNNAKLVSVLFVGDYLANSGMQLFDTITNKKVYYLAKNPTWNNITNYMGTPAEGITDSKYDVIEYYKNLMAYKGTLTTLLATSNSKYSNAKTKMRNYSAIANLFYIAIEAAKTTANDAAIKPYLTATEQSTVTSASAIREKYYQYYSSMYSKAKTLAATFSIAIADTQSILDKVTSKIGNTSTMKTTTTTTDTMNLQWAKQVESNGGTVTFSVTADSDGFVYACGYTIGTIMDGQIISGNSGFLSKYSPDGILQWTRILKNSMCKTVIIGSDGFLYMSGFTDYYIDDSLIDFTLTSTSQIFLSKYSLDGIVLQRTVSILPYALCLAMTIGLDGAIYIGGYTTNDNKGFLIKYTNVTETWKKTIEEPDYSNLYISGMTIDSDGFIYIGGIITQNTISHAYVAKYNTSGEEQWNIIDNSLTKSGIYSMSASSDGFIYAVGVAITGNNQTGMVVKYDKDGNKQWEKKSTYSTSSFSTELLVASTMDAKESIYVGGTSNFKTDPTILAIKYDANGNELSYINFNNGYTNNVAAIVALHSKNNLLYMSSYAKINDIVYSNIIVYDYKKTETIEIISNPVIEGLGINLNHVPQYTIAMPNNIDALEAQTISKITTLNGQAVSKVANSTKTTYTGVYTDFVSALDSINFTPTTTY